MLIPTTNSHAVLEAETVFRAAVFLAAALLVGCGTQPTSNGSGDGDRGNACLPNNTCNGDLACVEDVCEGVDDSVAGELGGACLEGNTCNGDLACVEGACQGADVPVEGPLVPGKFSGELVCDIHITQFDEGEGYEERVAFAWVVGAEGFPIDSDGQRVFPGQAWMPAYRLGDGLDDLATSEYEGAVNTLTETDDTYTIVADTSASITLPGGDELDVSGTGTAIYSQNARTQKRRNQAPAHTKHRTSARTVVTAFSNLNSQSSIPPPCRRSLISASPGRSTPTCRRPRFRPTSDSSLGRCRT